ncbi:hypothetical protein VTL71DRAFT_5565 [Oculimacula yallundae]|uniref:medium-chain acyl-CoA ligase n=1 Tax=Oculimacula yallundae TaxID=86028 RepID=A0ABR4C223_9HELO
MLPRKLRIAIAAPALILLFGQVRDFSSGDNVRDFGRGAFVFGFVLKFIDFGVLTRDGDVYKIKDKHSSIDHHGGVSISVNGVPLDDGKSLWRRFKESVELWLFTLRGIRWNWEVGGIPKREPQSASYFIFRTSLRILGSYLAWHLCKHAMGQFSYVRSINRGPFFDEPLTNQVILTWLHQLEAFCFINLPYQIGAFAAVATGYQTPADWPPLFGNLSDGYLVSRAWGRVWHQLLRRPLGMLTPHVQRWLGTTSRGSKRIVSLFCSFLMSGLVHWSGALNCPWTPSSHGMFTYFIMQAPLIRLEDWVVDWGRQKGIRGHALLKCFGYVWTVSWISFSMRYAARYQFEHGALSVHEPLKYSLIDLLIVRDRTLRQLLPDHRHFTTAHFSSSKLERPKDFNFARDVVDYWARKNQDSRAMYWVSQDLSKTRILTYSHFERESHRVASLLQKLGLAKGQRAILILPRTPAWWEIALASIRSGIVICPATTLLVAKDIEFRCNQTGATAFFGDKTNVEKFMKVKADCPTVKHVIQVDDPAKASDSAVIDYYQRLKLVEDAVTFQSPRLATSDPCLIYFTSGTSGPPKMVQHNQISYPLAHTLTGKHWLQLSPEKVYWNLSEQGWAKAAWSFFGTWNCGATLFVHDDRGAFDPLRVLDILHNHPITTLCAPPTAYRQLVLQKSKKYLKENPPKALSHCTGAGEPLNAGVIDEWQKMTGLEIFDGYGQTETVVTCGNFAGTAIRPGSMGKPTPGVPLKIISANGRECEPGAEGDLAILVDGTGGGAEDFFGLFDGYIRPDGTLDKRIKSLGGKEWYLTGDRATRDEDGYHWFVGRADDVINSSGYRIGPFEVESTLKLHPGVAESAVVSSPDESRGEVVKAFVVLTSEYKDSKNSDEIVKELQDFCKNNAAPYKYPRKIQLVDPDFLPKTISGKIKRNELKAAEWKKGKASKL